MESCRFAMRPSGYRPARAARGTGTLGKLLVPWLCALMVGTVAAQQPSGTQGSAALTVGAGHSDNVGRSIDEESDTFAEVGLTAALSAERRRIEGGLSGSLRYSDYTARNVTTRLTGNLSGGLTFRVVPGRFHWATTSQLRTVRRDVLQPESPINRESQLVSATGPDVFFPFGDHMSINLGGRYEERRWQESNRLDSDVVSSYLGISRQARRGQSVALTASHRAVEFDDPLALPFEVLGLRASYTREGELGRVALDGGVSELRYGDLRRRSPVMHASWQRALTARSTLTLFGRREVRDIGDNVADRVVADFDEDEGAVLARAPRISTTAGVGYTLGRDRARFGWDFAVGRERRDIEPQEPDDPLPDRRFWRTGASFSYPFGRAWTFGLGATYQREEIQAFDGESERYNGNMRLGRSFGRRLNLSFAYDYYRRESDFHTRLEENRVMTTVTWNIL
jgi:hypothetical protein